MATKHSSNSNYFSFDATKTQYFEVLDPVHKTLQRNKMINRRQQLSAALKNRTITDCKRRKFERLLWVLTGVLDHGLSIRKLYAILKTYERIDCVPTDYNQADLYIQNE